MNAADLTRRSMYHQYLCVYVYMLLSNCVLYSLYIMKQTIDLSRSNIDSSSCQLRRRKKNRVWGGSTLWNVDDSLGNLGGESLFERHEYCSHKWTSASPVHGKWRGSLSHGIKRNEKTTHQKKEKRRTKNKKKRLGWKFGGLAGPGPSVQHTTYCTYSKKRIKGSDSF